jgi:hypothetical protein
MAVLGLSYARHESANRFRRSGVPLALWLVIHRFGFLTRSQAFLRLNSAWGRNSFLELRLFMKKKTKVAIAFAGGVCLLLGAVAAAYAYGSSHCAKTGPGWMAVAPLSGDVFVSNSENSTWSNLAHLLGISDLDCSKPKAFFRTGSG